MPQQAPSPSSLLQTLSRARLVELGRELGVGLHDAPAVNQGALRDAVLTAQPSVGWLLDRFMRDELRAACRAHGVDERARGRDELVARLSGEAPKGPHGARASVRERRVAGALPRKGELCVVRQRQYLVTEVTPGANPGDSTRVSLVCLDDDAQGRPLEVFWELELGARVLAHEPFAPTAAGSDPRATRPLDPPRHFAAYLHALQWNSVSATDARLFQAPFRAGIRLFNHQLTPLKRALELPRVNLFIADDVGLGKTVEAGLVLQELLLRQRVERTLIVCPASVTLQWRDEMQKKFGLQFEIYDRPFVARRRQERGFGVNPWATHPRFIISYQTLRRPEYAESLRAALGDRALKSLLILDEAHAAAPSSAGRYAVDSQITHVVREVAPLFEHRLFLSATPHNGHSNSFSALLEILDPQRFTRGVPVTPEARDAVMVRRLKRDLRAVASGQFPVRRVVERALEHTPAGWLERATGEGAPRDLTNSVSDVDLRLSKLLAEYTALARPAKGPGRLVFVNLQKRLLSSVEAFTRTLQLHARAAGKGASRGAGEDSYGYDPDPDVDLDDEQREELEGALDARRSGSLEAPTGDARALLDEMLRLADGHRALPDARALSLLRWLREHACAGVGDPKAKRSPWGDTRVLLFTECGDTRRWIERILKDAVAHTDRGAERVMSFHGGMSDEAREEVQRAFNGPPGQYPVRILVATDAAREGVNLQGHCADLFHLDVPWNPARMEQRNGRIDRTLQPAPEVRCHYFVLPQRAEDRVLQTLVAKVDRIAEDLGSLSAVVMERLEGALAQGISERSNEEIERATQLGMFAETARRELETDRATAQRIAVEIDQAGELLESSRKVMDFDPRLLRDALNVGCSLDGAEDLAPAPRSDEEPGLELFTVPRLPAGWVTTLDTLRPARARGEYPEDWRRRPLLPVSFDPPARVSSAVAHLHLSHPFVQRVLGRFLSQGFSSHDLARVTAVRSPVGGVARVLAFARVSLYGAGATRLHDQLVRVAAPWYESKGGAHLRPFAEEADRRALDRFEEILAAAPTLDGIDPAVQARLARSARDDYAALWPHLESEAESIAKDAALKLEQRGNAEAAALRRVLEAQRAAINRALTGEQLALFTGAESEAPQRAQWEQDRKAMERRRQEIAREIETEPNALPALFRVVTRKVEPVGLVYLWPATR